MNATAFHVNVGANVVGGLIVVALLWLWVRSRGGICPVCGQARG